jgi:hypothetical protein
MSLLPGRSTSAVRVRAAQPPSVPYNPWQHLTERWPWVTVRVVPMKGDLLGQVQAGGAVIELRAGTSSGQRRSTLAHEIVHLERGWQVCGQWQQREEAQVHAMASRRLIRLPQLAAEIRALGGGEDLPALAIALDVDLATLKLRLSLIGPSERDVIRRALSSQRSLWELA